MRASIIIATLAFTTAFTTILPAYAQTPAAPAAKPSQDAVTVTAEQFKKFEGQYTLAPNFIITVFQKDGKFMTQATGQGSFEIFADSPNSFFAKVAPIKIEFTSNAAGAVTQLVLFQNGQTMPAPRIN